MDNPEQVVSEIQQRISLLCNFQGDDLKTEMSQLKKALMDNPAACQLLLPEDIGEMVTHLNKIVGREFIESTKTKEKKAPKAKEKKLSALELAALMKAVDEEEEENDDDND